MVDPFNQTDTVTHLLGLLDDSNQSNNSSLDEAPTLTTSASIKAAVLCVMAAASLIGNLATLISIAVTKKGTSSSLYTLLFQVSISNKKSIKS